MADAIGTWLPLLATLSHERADRRSLASIADQVGRSASYTQRAFTRVVKESPKQYTRRLQLECAAVLLLTREGSVLDVALESGFESHEGFTRAFAAHFDKTPSAFRRDAVASGLADAVRHAELLLHVGPCIGLFRTPLEPRKERTMNYDITIQDAPEVTVLYQEASCPHAAIAETLGRLLPAVFGYVTQNGIAMMGPPMTLYTHWGPGLVTMRGGLAVAPGTEGAGDTQAAVLPAGRLAVTIHTGPYDGLADAHAAIEAYVHAQGLEPNGPPREVYLTDPGEVPDPKDWKTQVAWPVA